MASQKMNKHWATKQMALANLEMLGERDTEVAALVIGALACPAAPERVRIVAISALAERIAERVGGIA